MSAFVKRENERSRVVHFALGLLFLGLLSIVGEPASADEFEHWAPAFSIESGLLVQRAQGVFGTTDVVGPVGPNWNGLNPLQPNSPSSGRDRMATPFVSAALEMLSPAWFDVPTKPRLMAHISVGAHFGPERDLAKLGSPGPFGLTPGLQFHTEDSILGTGSRTTVELDTLALAAGVGVAFTLQAWERTLRIKPAFEYIREGVSISGLVHRAVRQVNSPQNLADFRLVELRGREQKVYHGLGPGIEIEVDAERAGPLMLSLYGSARAYAILGDLETGFSASNQYGEAASWRFLANRWMFRGHVGLRFRWLPE